MRRADGSNSNQSGQIELLSMLVLHSIADRLLLVPRTTALLFADAEQLKHVAVQVLIDIHTQIQLHNVMLTEYQHTYRATHHTFEDKVMLTER